MKEFLDFFPKEPLELLSTRELNYKIDIVLGRIPISMALYQLWTNELSELKMQLHELLDKGFIWPSVIPWSTLVLFVKNKDGTFCMCIHCWLLNKVTIKNQHLFLRIGDLFIHLKGVNMFSKLYLRSRYHHIKVEEVDIPTTTFRAQYGHYEFLVLHFRFDGHRILISKNI